MTDLSEAIHPTVIANPNDSLVRDLVISRRTCRVVNHYRRPSGLDYMDRDIEGTTQGQDLWFASPYSGVAYGGTILLELSRRHQARVEGARTILSSGRR
jgi:hypothetical protein